MAYILVAEDEKSIADLICLGLSEAGHRYRCAYDGREAAMLIEQQHFDLALLDIMLPEVDGYELLEYLKPMGIPAIFVTARGSLKDKVKGLKWGADDYLVKPFEMAELIARVESVLRRVGKGVRYMEGAGLVIDTGAKLVTKGGVKMALTPKEYEVLLLFFQNPNIVLYQETIYRCVWGGECNHDTRTVALHVQRLRKKLGLEGYIKAVYKAGYRFEL